MKFCIGVIGFCFLFLQLDGQFNVLEGNLLGQWQDDNIPGSFAYNNAYNELWGLEVNGYEYAIIGSTLGTHFIDVTDPANLEESFFVSGKHTGPAIIHRDYHTNDGFLYAVSDEGQSSLQIIDIRMLPDSISVVYDSDELLQTSHNIFIDESQDRLYSCAHVGVASGYSAIRIFDIKDPLNPVDLGGTNVFGTFQVGHVHDAFVKDHIAYLNCGPDGFAIVDMTDLSDLTLLAFLFPDDYPDSGYNHSGWITEENDFYYMADEDHGHAIKAIDVSDYSDLEIVSTFDAEEEQDIAIPHNLIVHEDKLYVSYYYNGLQVYDIKDPGNPIRIMHYPTSNIPNGLSYEGAWGVYPFLPSGNILVSDMQEGLFVIENIDETVATDEINADLFKIFPNPVSDQLQIQVSSTGRYVYNVSDISGRRVGKGVLNGSENSLNINTFDTGTYFIELIGGTEIFTEKFVVIK